MNKGINENDLTRCDFQYQVRHIDTNCFKISETVFLKSNPDVPLIIKGIFKDHVNCCLLKEKRYEEVIAFAPESILQYKYAGLLIWKDKYKICIN